MSIADIDKPQPMITKMPPSVAIKARREVLAADQVKVEAALDQMLAGSTLPLSAIQAAASVGMTLAQLRYRYHAKMATLSEQYRIHRSAESKRRWGERLQTVGVVVRYLASEGINPTARQTIKRLRHLRLSLQNPRLRKAFRAARSGME